MKWLHNDGGRKAAGYKGLTGDCVTRSVAIASGLPYQEIYDALSDGSRNQRVTRGSRRKASSRNGVNVRRKWFKDYMKSIGFQWVSCMGIGTGCKVHLTDGELPMGRLVVSVSKHYTAVINGVIHDTHDPQREAHVIEPDTGRELRDGEWRNQNGICRIARRCVYGYWAIDSKGSAV